LNAKKSVDAAEVGLKPQQLIPNDDEQVTKSIFFVNFKTEIYLVYSAL
jgi:hypothetical protein